ncbi:MAG: hypothetical protein K2F66_08420 [Duncaniella sp.]|nr:hypothetical protein [Duncaniella sp.]
MIKLNIRYSGRGYGNKPCYIILHDTTFDICTPDYKGGSAREVEYSSIKHVCASENDLIIKIRRTEVVLHGIGLEKANGLAKVIEIGRNEPIEGSKAFREYRKAAEKEEARADRLQARVEKERDDKFQAEQEIERQMIDKSDTEDEIERKIYKLNQLFKKYHNHSDDDYKKLRMNILNIYEENVSILEIHFSYLKITNLAITKFQELKKYIEEEKREERLHFIILCTILGLSYAVYFILKYFGIINE